MTSLGINTVVSFVYTHNVDVINLHGYSAIIGSVLETALRNVDLPALGKLLQRNKKPKHKFCIKQFDI